MYICQWKNRAVFPGVDLDDKVRLFYHIGADANTEYQILTLAQYKRSKIHFFEQLVEICFLEYRCIKVSENTYTRTIMDESLNTFAFV